MNTNITLIFIRKVSTSSSCFVQNNCIKFCKNIPDFMYFTLSCIHYVLTNIILGGIAADNIFLYICYLKMLFASGMYRDGS